MQGKHVQIPRDTVRTCGHHTQLEQVSWLGHQITGSPRAAPITTRHRVGNIKPEQSKHHNVSRGQNHKQQTPPDASEDSGAEN